MGPAYMNKREQHPYFLRYECWAFPSEIVDLTDAELIALGFYGEGEPPRQYTHSSIVHYLPYTL
jgi:hypothetical protein